MNQFSTSLFKELVELFPDFAGKANQATEFLELEVPSSGIGSLGGIVIQTTEDNDIWLRNYLPYSSYSVNDSKELTSLLKEIFEDKLIWIIGMKDGEWIETTLARKLDDVDLESGVTYNLLSWSGSLDEIITVA